MRAGGTVNTGDIDWAALPALYAPFPSAINEYADSVHQRTTEWLRHFMVLANETAYRPFSDIKIGRLAARFHPDAPLDALQRNDVHNLVLILQHEQDLPLQAAFDRAIEMHNAEVRVFIDSASRLRQLDGPVDDVLRRFVTILETRMRGFLDRARESGRYHSSVSTGQPRIGSPR